MTKKVASTRFPLHADLRVIFNLAIFTRLLAQADFRKYT